MLPMQGSGPAGASRTMCCLPHLIEVWLNGGPVVCHGAIHLQQSSAGLEQVGLILRNGRAGRAGVEQAAGQIAKRAQGAAHRLALREDQVHVHLRAIQVLLHEAGSREALGLRGGVRGVGTRSGVCVGWGWGVCQTCNSQDRSCLAQQPHKQTQPLLLLPIPNACRALPAAPTFAFASSSGVACRTTPFSMMVAASSLHTCTGTTRWRSCHACICCPTTVQPSGHSAELPQAAAL